MLNAQNLRLLAERVAREKDSLGPNWQMLATITPVNRTRKSATCIRLSMQSGF